MSLLAELKRRSVLRVGAAYLVGSWLVIQVVETVLPAFGVAEGAVRIAVILLAIGFVPALVLAWVFQFTPEGLKRDTELDPTAPVDPRSARTLDRVVIVALALAAGILAVDKFLLQSVERGEGIAHTDSARTPETAGPSIAVLPFIDLSPSGDQAYLADGFAESLLNVLAKIPELRVISRSSAFSFKGSRAKPAEIARELRVSHILEGSVRLVGDRIRVSVQLVEPYSDTQLMAETFDREMQDVFAIQDEITAAILARLKPSLLGAAPTTESMAPGSYVLYLQAQELAAQLSRESMTAAAERYQQALAVDPDNADAWRGLASLRLNMTNRGILPREEGYRLAREAAERAIGLDPANAGACLALATYSEVYEGNLEGAVRWYQKALRLAPGSAAVLGDTAMFLASLGRLHEAVELAEQAVARDPVSPIQLGNLGALYYWSRRPEPAIATLRTVATMSPGYFAIRYRIGESLLMAGRPAEALAEMEAEDFEGYRLIGLALARHALGDAAGSNAALAEVIAALENQAAYNIATVYAYRGQDDEAFGYLERELELSGPGVFREVLADPLLEGLHDDSRWQALLERIGRSPQRLSAIEFEIELSSS